ncbi:unnamed protein product [Pedinophyceae sp. YPF-701]|nr:unnamed protein product [Pedinophyceae sp. YPF-701]
MPASLHAPASLRAPIADGARRQRLPARTSVAARARGFGRTSDASAQRAGDSADGDGAAGTAGTAQKPGIAGPGDRDPPGAPAARMKAETSAGPGAPGGDAAQRDAALEPLPEVGRARVLGVCAATSGAMAVGAALLHPLIPIVSGALGADADRVYALSDGFGSSGAVGVAAAVAGAAAVTAGRVFLLDNNADFKAASDRSNAQVLSPLSWIDLPVVAVLPGSSEEALFRASLIPMLGGGWPAVAASGAAFGALHAGGGRNAVFATWAAAVGVLYGALMLWTGDCLVPIGAHAGANLAAAALWKSQNPRRKGKGKGRK